MMTWGLQTGPEKAELQELNARLCDYVRRVRELERENLLLEEELRARRAHESLEAEGQARFADAARRLREQLAELGRAVALAEGERDALRRELTGLRLLGDEARAARGRLDAELSAQRRELQEALGARAALEALLGRLLAERDGLDATHERDVRALRLRARHAGPPLLYRARAHGLAAPPPGLRELHASCARLVAESWGETARRCEDEVRALEEALRRGGESRRRAEEEARLCAREAEALRREAQELERLRARLEDELARMREASELQAEERQRIIACLEDEKADLTLAMADRLRDYQELMQVKTGLSLEVATYRALLEGESNPEILLVTEHIENIPHDFRDTFKYSSSAVQRENERNLFLRQKAPLPVARLDLGLRPALSTSLRSRAGMDSETRRGFLSSGYSSLTTSRQESTCGKTTSGQTTFRTLSPTRGSSWNTEAQVQAFPLRPQDTPASVTREPTVLTGISESTRSSERTTAVLGKKAETKGTREPERSRVEIVQTKREEKMFDSKEKASEERNLRWEELTKLDRDTRKRESQQRQDKAKGKELLAEKGQREREIPIKVEAVQDSSPEVSPKDLQTPLNELAGGGTTGGMEVKETRFRLVTSDTVGTTESIAENLVSDILKQFTHSPQAEGSSHPFPDTKVTYVGKKELPGEGKARTEIVMESKLTEEIDVSDTAGLEHLLSKDAKEVELKGKSAERMISDIIHLGLKGHEGQAKVVNVEIVEEPVSYVRGEQTHDVSTPFHVEEVEDMSPGPEGLEEEEEEEGEEGVQKHPLFPGEQYQKGKKPRESVTQVEEVTDVGDWEGEQSYFVSTPDDHPGDQDGDRGSVYGQIHIEEKATIRYSWQDEITTPGIQRRAGRDEAAGEKVVELQGVGEPSTEGKEGSAGWRGQVKQGEFHTAPIIIDKEIKIPHEFHTAIRGSPKEPRQQLVEVMGQLEESLPERVKTELSALAREAPGSPGSVSVDVQKVQAAGSGAMTLVAEVNLSQTVDADQLDLEELSRDEARDIERAVESVVRDSLARQHSPVPGSPEQEREAPAAGLLFRRWATQELYTSTGEEEEDVGSGQVTPHSPVSATVEVTSPRGYKAQSHVLEDISQSVRLVQIGPTGTWSTEQASPAAVVEVSGEGGLDRAASWSVRNLMTGPCQSRESTEATWPGASPEAEASQAGFCIESGRHRESGFGQSHVARGTIFQGVIAGPGETGDSLPREEPVGTQTSVMHHQLGSREQLGEPIQFLVPLSDKVELAVGGGSMNTQEWLEKGVSVRHINVGSQRSLSSRQTDTQPREPGDSESSGYSSAEGTQATRSYTVGRKVLMTKKSSFQRASSEFPKEPGVGDMFGAEGASVMSRSFRHMQLSPVEMQTLGNNLTFSGPVSPTFGLAGSVARPEPSISADDPRTLKQAVLGPKDTSFTFQMDVSHLEATPGWARETTVLLPAGVEVEAPGQSSVISDEKKVAFLYLDNQEEEQEENDGQWF